MKHRTILLILLFTLLSCATLVKSSALPDVQISTEKMYTDVEFLTGLIPSRSFDNLSSLNKAASYIASRFQESGLDPKYQPFMVDEHEYKNVIASVGPLNADRFIVGAHYDVHGEQSGADDNASGVAGLLALASLLKSHEEHLKIRIDLVAYTLEEPPFFRTDKMGSYIHAKSVAAKNSKIIGMAALEMIGYYTEAPNSQEFPISLMKIFYPSTGNFIGVVSNFSSSGLKNHFKEHMAKTAIQVETMSAPSILTGVDFSDHLNYWKFEFDAIMITDTAFYRNPNYHKPTDTIETLDFQKMKEVVKGVHWSLINLTSKS